MCLVSSVKPTTTAQIPASVPYLVLGQLQFDLVWFVGDLQLRVQAALGFLQPVGQLPPRLVELQMRGERDTVQKLQEHTLSSLNSSQRTPTRSDSLALRPNNHIRAEAHDGLPLN